MNQPLLPIVSLPWYDTPQSAAKIDAFWLVLRRELQRRLDIVPVQLERTRPLSEQWLDPHLLLSQCCGPDLIATGAGNLVPLVRPVFSDLDCPHGSYYSFVVKRRGGYVVKRRGGYVVKRRSEDTGGRAAINAITSQSGLIALKSWWRRNGTTSDPQFEQDLLVTGSHQGSIDALRRGQADVAAIDAHSWPLLDHAGVIIVDQTPPTPAPPFVCHEQSQQFAREVVAALTAAVHQAGNLLDISALIPTTREDYEPKSVGAE